MGEVHRDVSDSNKTPQIKKKNNHVERSLVRPLFCVCICTYESVCAYMCWEARVGFETLPHYLYGETLPGFLRIQNPGAFPNKQEHILTLHPLVLYQKITFSCTVGKQDAL